MRPYATARCALLAAQQSHTQELLWRVVAHNMIGDIQEKHDRAKPNSGRLEDGRGAGSKKTQSPAPAARFLDSDRAAVALW
jgi:hypothetical protein